MTFWTRLDESGRQGRQSESAKGISRSVCDAIFVKKVAGYAKDTYYERVQTPGSCEILAHADKHRPARLLHTTVYGSLRRVSPGRVRMAPGRPNSGGGFTMVEILVTMVVITIMLVATGSSMGMFSGGATQSE